MISRRTSLSGIVARVVIVLAVLALGILIGGHPSWLPGPLRSAFTTNNNSVVDQALAAIERDYYRKLNPSDLANGSVSGAVASLDDPFSRYISPADYRSFGRPGPEVSGIGIEPGPDKLGLQVLEVFPGTPAAEAGLVAGDVIVAVNGTSLAGRSTTFAAELIRGPAGTSVTLTVLGNGRRQLVRITRRSFAAPIADDRLLVYRGVRLGYVQLTTFNQQGAGDEVRADVQQMLAQGARGILLDLRDNGGGLIEEAVNTASIFIPDGTIVSTDGRNSPRQVFTATGNAISTAIPVVVLVDHGTASASEIVTAALQDRHRALVVGTHTFGKGVFQDVQQLPNGGALDITAGYYYTPDGRNLGGGGVKRGAGVTPNVYASDNPNSTQDEALTVAERVLAGQVR